MPKSISDMLSVSMILHSLSNDLDTILPQKWESKFRTTPGFWSCPLFVERSYIGQDTV